MVSCVCGVQAPAAPTRRRGFVVVQGETLHSNEARAARVHGEPSPALQATLSRGNRTLRDHAGHGNRGRVRGENKHSSRNAPRSARTRNMRSKVR
jgi:hypothetical protein